MRCNVRNVITVLLKLNLLNDNNPLLCGQKIYKVDSKVAVIKWPVLKGKEVKLVTEKLVTTAAAAAAVAAAAAAIVNSNKRKK